MENEGKTGMNVEIFSFGFKYGAPEDVNYIFDVRFLPNPYWEENLRAKTGLVEEVADYVLNSKEAISLLEHLYPMILFLVKENNEAGKENLKFGIGCTGGRHRSVAVVQRLLSLLHRDGLYVSGFHRDIEKDGL